MTPAPKTDAEKVRAGMNAQAVLSDPTYVAAFDAVERELVAAWVQSGALQQAEREAIWNQLQGLRTVRAKLETAAAVGRAADANITRKAKETNGIPSHYRLT